jgi:peptidoglycan/xylan/chitin deacetylase (PgdA/CDA1 family)
MVAAISCASGMASPARPRSRLPDGARAVVSLTYDDGQESQLKYAIPALDARGLKATFFLTEDNVQGQVGQWEQVAARGHEVEDHTVSHPCNLRGYNPSEFLRQEIEPMESFLDANFGVDRRRIFAYPCGVEGLGRGSVPAEHARYVRALKDEFVAARTVEGPPNNVRTVDRRRFRLSAFEPTYDEDSPGPAIRYVRGAMAEGAWAILVFHRVLPRRLAEGDTSIEVHDRILDWLGREPVWCAPMGQAFQHLTDRT